MQEEGNGSEFSERNRGRSDKALVKTFSEEANDLRFLLKILQSLFGVRLPTASIPKEEGVNC